MARQRQRQVVWRKRAAVLGPALPITTSEFAPANADASTEAAPSIGLLQFKDGEPG